MAYLHIAVEAISHFFFPLILKKVMLAHGSIRHPVSRERAREKLSIL